MAELRTVHKVVLRELNHLCVLADLTKVEDRLDNVAKKDPCYNADVTSTPVGSFRRVLWTFLCGANLGA